MKSYNYGQQNYVPNSQPMYNQKITEADLPYEFRPISMWGYFGYQILFAIPVIGFILLIVFALGGTRNVNVKNFARSYFCILIIVLVVVLIFVAMGGSLAIFNGISNL